MKNKIYTSLLMLLVIAGAVKAQVPNSNFEELNFDGTLRNWGSVYLFSVTLDSNGVSTTDSIVFGNTYFYAPSTDAFTGNYALELSNAYNFTTGMGIAGRVSCDTDTVYSAWGSIEMIASSIQPTEMNFHYKFLPAGNDSAIAGIYVYDAFGTVIGQGEMIIGSAVTAYTYATIPVVYTSANPAAAYSLVFSNQVGYSEVNLGTRFLIDDVSFITTGVPSLESQDGFVLYPNPAHDYISFSRKTDAPVKITVFDVSGKNCFSGTLQAGSTGLQLPRLNPGVYNLQFSDKSVIWNRKLVIGN